MKVVAFDPGGITGVALYDSLVDTPGMIPVAQLHKLAEVWELLQSTKPDLIVFERFSYQRRDKVVLTPVEVIGVIKLWADLHDVPYKAQMPSQAMGFWKDDKLKRIEQWRTGQPHAMDALRHLLYYLVVVKGDQSWLGPLKRS